MVSSSSWMLSFLLLCAYGLGSDLEELTMVQCDGRGNFVNVNEFGVDIIGASSLIFDVKACQFVIVALTKTSIIADNKGSYVLTILGYKDNSILSIKDSCYKCNRGASVKVNNLLKCDNFVPVWIRWDKDTGLVELGQGHVVGERTLITYTRKIAGPFYFIHVTSAKNTIAHVKFFKRPMPPPGIENEGKKEEFHFVRPRADGGSVVTLRENVPLNRNIYYLELSNHETSFKIVPNGENFFECHGDYLILKTELDFEKQEKHFVTISSGTTFATLTIEVLDVNDNVPTIVAAADSYYILQTPSPLISYRGFYVISDNDAHDSLDVKLVSVLPLSLTDAVTFTEDEGLKVTMSLGDETEIVLRMAVSDSEAQMSSCDIKLKVIKTDSKVCELPDTKNYFISPAHDRSTRIKIQEGNVGKPRAIYRLRLNEELGQPRFMLKWGRKDFVIRGHFLMLVRTLNYTRKSSYALEISSGELVTLMHIDVIQLTKSPELHMQFAHNEIPEELPVGYVLGRVEPKHDLVKYNYTIRGRDAEYFIMDVETDELTIRQRIDRESLTGDRHLEFNLTITFQTFTESHSCSLLKQLRITDVNDNIPTFSSHVFYVTLNEQIKRGFLQDFRCMDADEGGNGRCSVHTDNEMGGELSLQDRHPVAAAGKLNMSRTRDYILAVFATDHPPAGTVHTGTAVVVIKVERRNDHSPLFISPPTKNKTHFLPITIPRDIPVSTLVTMFRATDDDVKYNHSFNITSISCISKPSVLSSNPFSLDSNTGKLVIVANHGDDVIFDCSTYNLVISVFDGMHVRRAVLDITIHRSNAHTLTFKHTLTFDQAVYTVSNYTSNTTLLNFHLRTIQSKHSLHPGNNQSKDSLNLENNQSNHPIHLGNNQSKDFLNFENNQSKHPIHLENNQSEQPSDVILLMSEKNNASMNGTSDWLEKTDNFDFERGTDGWILKRRTDIDSVKGKILVMRAADKKSPDDYAVAVVVLNGRSCDLKRPSTLSSTMSRSHFSTSRLSNQQSTEYTIAMKSQSDSVKFTSSSSSSSSSASSSSSTSSKPTTTTTTLSSRSSEQTSHTVLVSTDLLVWRLDLHVDMVWKSQYMTSREGKQIISDVVLQLSEAFSQQSGFNKAEVLRISDGGDDVVARCALYFTSTTNESAISRILQGLEKKPVQVLEKFHTITMSDHCTATSDVEEPATDLMGLNALCIVEGGILFILIIAILFTKICLNKKAATIETKDAMHVQRIEILKAETSHLENMMDILRQKNAKLKSTLIDGVTTTPVDDVIINQDNDVTVKPVDEVTMKQDDAVTMNQVDDVTMKQDDDVTMNPVDEPEGKGSNSDHHGDVYRRDSALWSSVTVFDVDDSKSSPKHTSICETVAIANRASSSDRNGVIAEAIKEIQEETGLKAESVDDETKPGNSGKQTGFTELVCDAMRFKYVLEDEKRSASVIPVIYTQNSFCSNSESTERNIERLDFHDH